MIYNEFIMKGDNECRREWLSGKRLLLSFLWFLLVLPLFLPLLPFWVLSFSFTNLNVWQGWAVLQSVRADVGCEWG